MQKCPKCDSGQIQRSRAKSRMEQMRKFLSFARPHRCRACGWRGWGAETALQSPILPHGVVAPLDLAVLDALDARPGLLHERSDSGHTDKV